MQRYINNLTDRNGNAISGASVTVLNAAGASAALYSDNGVTTKTNPTTTDAYGEFSFYAANGVYSITITGQGFSTKTTTGVLLNDAPVNVNDYTTPAVADASGVTLFVSQDTTTTIATGAALTANYWGPKQITTADSNKRGKWFSAIGAAPSVLGNENSIDTAFNGDWSHAQFPVEHRVTGVATLSQPASGYVYTPEAMPHYTYLFNSSGWNQQTGGNDGRTGVAAYRTKVYQAGQGDAVAFNASVFVTGARAGATHWLANPAGVLVNGDMQAGQAGVYLNPFEVLLTDAGFDVAAIGSVINLNRTNATGALSAVWDGHRLQNIGSVACDAMFSATGKWQTGLDFSMSTLDFGANRAAISLKSNQRIYLNSAATASGNLGADWRTTVFNTDWIGYDSSISGFILTLGGNSVLKATSTSFGVLGASPVSQKTGWGTPTNIGVVANFNGSTATLPQTAQAVAQIITDLKALGFYGA